MLAIAQKLGFQDLKTFRASLKANPKMKSSLARGAARRLSQLPHPHAGQAARSSSAACPRPRLKSSRFPITWRRPPRPPTTSPARPTAAVPAACSSTPTTPPIAISTASKPSPTTKAFPATTCRSPSPRSSRTSRLPQVSALHRLRRRLGPLRRAPRQGCRLLPGPLLRLRPPRRRHLAGDPPGGRHRRPLPALDPRTDGPVLPRPLQHRRHQHPVRG